MGDRGLEWVRLDASWPRNPKILGLTSRKQWRALVVYVSGLAYSGEHGLDGFLPAHCLPWLHGTTADAQTLIDAGLWVELPDMDGWAIHDWDCYQLSSEEIEARRGRFAAMARARWDRAKLNGNH